MAKRKQSAGRRNHIADVYSHIGSQDEDGWPDDEAGEFISLVSGLPCMLTSHHANDETHSHTLYCEYHSGSLIEPRYRIVINDETYEVLSVDDVWGTYRELLVELKKIDVPTPSHTDQGS